MRFLLLCMAFVACSGSVDQEIGQDAVSYTVDNSVYDCLATRVDQAGQPQFFFVTRDGQPIRRCTLGCDGKKCLAPPVFCPGNKDIECEDEIPCTADTCVNGRCEYSPDDGLCPGSGNTCAVEYGACTKYCYEDGDCDLGYGHECLDPGPANYISEGALMKCDVNTHTCLVTFSLRQCSIGMSCIMTSDRCVNSE